jgi:alpha-galactosidase
MNPQLFRLDSSDTTLLLLSIDQAIPAVAYYGTKLNTAIDAESVFALSGDAIPNAKLDNRTQLSLLPENSHGFFGEPGLRGHRNGRNFTHRFVVRNVKQNAQQLCLFASDADAGLQLEITISFDTKSNVFCWKHTLINQAETPYTLDYLACPTLPMPLSMDQLTTLHGRWGNEFQEQTIELEAGKYQIDNRRGRTSHEHFPGMIVSKSTTGELAGNAIAAHLGWSGNYRLLIDSISEHQRYLQCGELLLPGEIILTQNQSYETPVLYTTQTGSGISKVSQQLHQYARNNLLPKWTRSTRPVHSNSWEALYFDHDMDKLIALVDAAHATGAERFILDDGWFVGRRSDNAGLGDWQVDETIYPDGLHPLVNHVRSKGMQFGLWFEPEMVNSDSALFRAHPEWPLKHAPYPLIPARNQEVLDLNQPELFEYLFHSMSTLIEEYQIEYIKWDMNRDTLNAGADQQASQHKQVHAVYRLMDALNKKHPGLEIESCASGGARVDFGVLQHTGRVWTSDNIDPIERISIQRGFSLFFPPEIMGAHIGSKIAHLTGRQTTLDTRAIVALQGQTGFEFDSRKLDNDERKTVKHYTDIYKQNREWLASSLLWRLPPIQGCLHISGMVSQDKTQSLWTIASDGSHLQATPGKLTLYGLAPEAIYQVVCLNDNLPHLAHFGKALPLWMDDNSLKISGELLMRLGFLLPYMPPQTALLLSCRMVNHEY